MVIIFDDEIREIALEIADLLIKKRKDYGDSFDKIWDEMGMISVIVRLRDKIARLQNLYNNEDDPNYESIEDTFRDIAGYALLSLRMIKHAKKD